MLGRKLFVALLAGMALLALPGNGMGAETHIATDRTVKNPDDGTTIAFTVFKPAGADRNDRVPVILHSHGWGGSRETTVSGVVKQFLDAGFGVVSVDQRGHGESGGEANIQDPTKETEDIKRVIDYIASLTWVQHDRNADGTVRKNDPVLGAIGGSYGGGYQTMTALDEIADEGRTRFNALAPEITWYDLPESLAPQGVVRTAWDTLLYAVGAVNLPQYVHEAFAWGAVTGQWPDGTVLGEEVEGVPNLDAELHKHSPVWFVQRGIKLDVPILLRQGASDNLFNFNQGVDIFRKATTISARNRSYFVSYNGGHALPNTVPLGTASGDDACSPNGFTNLTIKFFRKVFAGESTSRLMPSRFNLTTVAGDECLRLDGLNDSTTVPVVDPLGSGSIVSTAGAGAPLQIEVAQGPLTLGGVPKLTGNVTTAGIESRAFFGLAMGTSPADAQVIQNNLMPLRREFPGTDEKFAIELPGVAAEIPDGQSLFLTVTPLSDIYFGHGSRTPGALVMSNVQLHLPTPGADG